MWTRGYGFVPGLGQVASNYYEFEKIEENPVSGQVSAAWQQRCGKLYFLVNEKYTSQLSFLTLPATALSLLPEMPGYLDGGVRLVDETHAKGYLQIPGINGRDTKDLTIASENGIEYLYLDSQKFIGAESVPAVYDGENAICTILPGGDARWYTVGNAAGKTHDRPLRSRGRCCGL